MALADAPLIEQLRFRGLLHDPVLHPRFLDDPAAQARLRQAGAVTGLADLIGDPQ
jgi:hypothetical protein